MRSGLIVPSSNTTMESEFYRLAFRWTSLHIARIKLQKITITALEKMEEDMLDAAGRLADAGVDIIGYGCTSGSFVKGKDHGREIERKITEMTKIPAVSTSTAVIQAFDKLCINKVSVATPYIDEINDFEEKFLEQNKIQVLSIKGLGISDNREIGNKDPRNAYDLAKEVYVPEADGLFISCTNFRTIEVIDPLEIELGVPVISSNTATLWAMMKKAGISRKLAKHGQLFLR